MPHKQSRVRVERGLYRADDTYYASVTPPGSRRPRWKSLGKVNLSRARVLRDAFAVEVRSGRAHSSTNTRRTTFASVATDWLAMQERLVTVGELGTRTYDAYETAVRLHLSPHFGLRLIQSITADDLADWHAEQRAAGAATWSIKGRWTPLRLILSYAARRHIIDANPADLLARRERPKAGESRQRFLTDAEMEQLLRTARRYRPLIALCLFGGLRLSEALALEWNEIDFAEAKIRVRYQLSRKQSKRVRLKSGAGRRDVILMPALANVLREHKLASGHSDEGSRVFATASGRSVSQRNATRAFEAAVKRAKLDGANFHALRHTFASILIGQGRDPVFVADQLGHSKPGFTLNTYAHLFRAARHAREARKQLEAEYGDLLRGASKGASDS